MANRLRNGSHSVPRIARIAWPGCPYHVTHRGNRRGLVFLEEGDRAAYLELLRTVAQREGLKIWAYCLMPNHVHLVVVGEYERSMARAIGNAHRRHAQRINAREHWSGHLWSSRFYSTPMDESHLWAAVRYVELNPVRAGLVRRPDEYPWSSARQHATGSEDPILDPARPFPGAISSWVEWLLEGLGDVTAHAIRSGTSTGRPCGSDGFIQELEHRIDRVVAAKPHGRPRRQPLGKRLLSP